MHLWGRVKDFCFQTFPLLLTSTKFTSFNPHFPKKGNQAGLGLTADVQLPELETSASVAQPQACGVFSWSRASAEGFPGVGLLSKPHRVLFAAAAASKQNSS